MEDERGRARWRCMQNRKWKSLWTCRRWMNEWMNVWMNGFWGIYFGVFETNLCSNLNNTNTKVTGWQVVKFCQSALSEIRNLTSASSVQQLLLLLLAIELRVIPIQLTYYALLPEWWQIGQQSHSQHSWLVCRSPRRTHKQTFPMR